MLGPIDVPQEVSVSSCTHISEATSHRASPYSVACVAGPLDMHQSYSRVCVENTGSWCIISV